MSYIKKSLSENESIVGRFHPHAFAWLKPAAWLTLAAAGGFALMAVNSWIGFVAFIALHIPGWWFILNLLTLEQGVTNKRVVLKTGVIGRATDEMKLSSIETVEIQQTPMGRMCNYGDIHVTGRGISDVVFRMIDDPLKVKRMIESASNPG